MPVSCGMFVSTTAKVTDAIVALGVSPGEEIFGIAHEPTQNRTRIIPRMPPILRKGTALGRTNLTELKNLEKLSLSAAI